MPRSRPHRSAGLLAEGAPAPEWPALLTQVAFLLALIVVCARAFMAEPLYTTSDLASVLLNAPRSAGPAASLVLDTLAILPALLVLTRRLVDRTYILRFAWSHALMAALALWMALSIAWSTDRFAAMLNAAHFISALALLWSASQLVRSWGRLRLVAAAGCGLLLIFVAAGLHQRLIEHPTHVREWNDPASEVGRAAYLKSHDLTETDFRFKQIESNLLSGHLRLFGNSPNTYAAALSLLLTLTLGLLFQRFANRDPLGWAIALLLPLPAAAFCLYHTHSLAAYATPLIALALFLAVRQLRHWLPTHTRQAYWATLALLALGTIALVAHGLYHHSLFVKTLTFRWYYWTGAARLLAAHPFAGVGWANFGYYYPAVRDALATEQVKDPHNFLVRPFVELGLIGGLLFLAWMLRTAWEATRPLIPPATAASPVQGNLRGLLFLAIPAVAASALNLLANVDFAQPASYVTLQCFERFVAAILLLLGLAIAALQSLKDEKLDERPCPWVLYGILIALAMLLVHNLIDFSFYEPGPMFLFALLGGSVVGVRQPSVAGKSRQTPAVMVATALAAIAFLGFLAFACIPTIVAEAYAASGDAAFRDKHYRQAASDYNYAFNFQRWNAEYAFRAAQAASASEGAGLYVDGMAQSAIQTNPRVIRYHVFRANIEQRRPSPDVQTIRLAYQSALKLDPRDIDLRLEYAATMEKLNDPVTAAAQYEEALRHDAALPPDEPKRLPPARRANYEQKIQQLKTSPPATKPAAP